MTERTTLYLASASPRRRSLVGLLGVKNIVIRPTHVDESHDGMSAPETLVQELSVAKALALLPLLEEGDPHGIILGADTIVELHGEILGKPTNEDDAVAMLVKLSGNTHTVYTGFALVDTLTQEMRTYYQTTNVTFRELASEEIERYVASGAPMDKAGAYGIQEDFGAVFVTRIEGDYYTVVGLPLCSLYVELKKFAPELFL